MQMFLVAFRTLIYLWKYLGLDLAEKVSLSPPADLFLSSTLSLTFVSWQLLDFLYHVYSLSLILDHPLLPCFFQIS